MRKQKGFTLVELLVVIAIIGLLSTLAVVALNNARTKARDARRVSDIKQIQTALEMHYNDNGGYPLTAAGPVSGAAFGTTMAAVPVNPTPGGATYTYTSTDVSTYQLTYTLEGTVTGITGSGAHTATPAGIANP